MSRKRFGLGTRVSLSGITGDAIPTLQIRGANQTAPVVDIDSTGFPTDATPFFRVFRNGTRLIDILGNQNIIVGATILSSFNELISSPGRIIGWNQSSTTVPPINAYVQAGHTGLAYRLQSGVSTDFSTATPNGTFQWGINSANGGKHARFTTGIGSSNAAHGTVQITTGGTVTVTNTYCQAGDVIYHSRIAAGGTLGHTTAVAANGSFTITSNNTSDTSTFAWMIVRPA
jgi:hypothetical protein